MLNRILKGAVEMAAGDIDLVNDRLLIMDDSETHIGLKIKRVSLAALNAAALSTTGNVVDLVGEGVPDDAVQATWNVNPTGDDNSLTFTAVAYGEEGNDITVAYVDPGSASAALSVDVVGSAITVNLGTDTASAINSTAADVLAAIEGDAAADALVSVAIHTGDTGTADDGSGVVTAMAAHALEDGAGTGIAVAGPGSRYTDITNAKLYINGGTLAVPVWKLVTSAA